MNFGRLVDSEHTEGLIARQPTPMASAAMQFTGDDNANVFFPDIFFKVTGKKWNSMNQNPRGICVAMGWSKSITAFLAVLAYLGKITFPGLVAPHPIYGGARFEIGYQKYGNRPSGNPNDPEDDGAVGSWAGEWVTERGGVLLMKKYPELDLSTFSPNDVAANYGYKGVPDAIEPTAKLFPVKQLTLCQTFADVWSMIGQLYPVNVCSSQGFSLQRDSNGYCRPNDRWNHCMWYCGRITLGGKRWIIIDNSWDGQEDGRGILGGPITITADNGEVFELTGNMFLADEDTINAMCTGGRLGARSNQRETFAIAGVEGFVKQRELFLI